MRTSDFVPSPRASGKRLRSLLSELIENFAGHLVGKAAYVWPIDNTVHVVSTYTRGTQIKHGVPLGLIKIQLFPPLNIIIDSLSLHISSHTYPTVWLSRYGLKYPF